MTVQNSCAVMVVQEALQPPPLAFKKRKRDFFACILLSQTHFLFK